MAAIVRGFVTVMPSEEVQAVHFSPDQMVPAQLARASVESPERALMVAVLRDALECAEHVQSQDATRRRHAMAACAWISSEAVHWLYAFESICDVLEMDPWTVRAIVQRQLNARAREVTRRPARVVPISRPS